LWEVKSLNINWPFLPQGQILKTKQGCEYLHKMDKEGFGSCTFTQACEAVCPKEISIVIFQLGGEYSKAGLLIEN